MSSDEESSVEEATEEIVEETNKEISQEDVEDVEEEPPTEPSAVQADLDPSEDPSEDPSDSVIEEGNEDDASAYEENPPQKKKIEDIEIPEVDEEDEEVRMAMEMALAAMKNPKLNPDQLRKLVLANQAGDSKQSSFQKEVEEKKAQQKKREQEEAQKRWNEQKENMFGWITTSAAAFNQAAEEYQWQQQKIKYAEKIKKDPKIRDTRKAIKAKRKSLKAVRLQGNRVETRHIFKRQRMEKHLIEVTGNIERCRKEFCETNYDAHAYAKAIMKASKKWDKKPANDQELVLEAQLCRNMHQMLALEKQKAKLKKSLKELKKYLQRCKSWLSDKQALCELHMLTLDATATSMKNIYEDTLTRQDALIAKLKVEPEFAEQGDLKELLASVPDVQKYDEIPTHAGPGALLNAMRGLPFRDSIYLVKGENLDDSPLEEQENEGNNEQKIVIEGAPPSPDRQAGRKELFISTNSDDAASISSALTDPDDDPYHFSSAVAEMTGDDVVSADSVSGKIAFGEDAPWMMGEETAEKEPSKDLKKHKGKKQSMGSHEKSFDKFKAPTENTTRFDNDDKPASRDKLKPANQTTKTDSSLTDEESDPAKDSEEVPVVDQLE